VGGKPEIFRDSRIPRLDQGFQRSSGGDAVLRLFHAAYRVKLEQVEAVGAESPQRITHLLRRLRPAAVRGLACQEDLVPQSDEGWSQLLLRVAVGGRDIVVVDPAVERLARPPVCLLLLCAHHNDAPHRDDGQLHVRVSILPIMHVCIRLYLLLTRASRLGAAALTRHDF
jgi:hypothetical protein